jgi:hypothetical protein
MKTLLKVAGIVIGGPLLLALVSSPVAFAAGIRIDFRGVPLGSTEREFVAATPGIHCSDRAVAERELGDRSCYSADDKAVLAYAGIQAKSLTAHFYRDRLSSILVSISPDQFKQVTDALRVKFGPPTSDHSRPFKMPRGLVGKDRVIVWQSGGSSITAFYFNSLGWSNVEYSTAEGLREFTKRSAEAHKADVKGL